MAARIRRAKRQNRHADRLSAGHFRSSETSFTFCLRRLFFTHLERKAMSRLQFPASLTRMPTLATRLQGFTLIEVLTTIMIIGILTAIALPNYQEYVRRSSVVEAQTVLSDMRVKLEQYYLDNRSYAGAGVTCGVANPTAKYFSIGCTSAGQTYTVTATGNVGAAAGHTYTINESNAKTTTVFKGQAVTGKNCWLVKDISEC
jgi:type IV pilus assembly protein PilE